MFQYTHEVIINSLNRDGHDLLQPAAGMLTILRSGSYKKEYIVDSKIYKTPGYEGKISNLILDFTDTSAFTNDGTYRLTIFTKMPNKFLGEYANANWYEFGKPLMVEVDCVGTMTAEILMNKFASAIKLALPENNQWLKIVTSDSSKITISTKDPYMIFSGATIEYYEPTGCDSCVGYYEKVQSLTYADTKKTTNMEIINGFEPFATANWITENLRFPSYPNIRYASPNSDEIPTPGAIYTMYSFAYDVVRKGLGGLSVVGQKTESITRHIYYVRQDLVKAFDEAIEEAFGSNVIIEKYATYILSANTIANDGVAVELKADTYPHSDSMTYTWTITDENGTPGSEPEGVSISGQAITASEEATAETEFFVTCKPSDSNYKSVTKKFVVIEG